MRTTLFIADLHLSEAQPEITAALLDFLQHKAPAADALYVLGDLFEYWIGDDEETPLQQQVAEAFCTCTSRGSRCTLFMATETFCSVRPTRAAAA